MTTSTVTSLFEHTSKSHYHSGMDNGGSRRPPANGTGGTDPVVFIIDADETGRVLLQGLLESVDIRSRCFGNVSEFVAHGIPDRPVCLVLDVRLPGVSGLAFQEQLVRSGFRIPIVFLTGHADIQMTVRAMKAGAVDFLTKPFREQDLLEAVTTALQRDLKRRREIDATADLRRRVAQLTEREREVMPMVTAGRMNKQIAAALDISQSTVKIHRGSIMRKMSARSVPDLVRMVDALSEQAELPTMPLLVS